MAHYAPFPGGLASYNNSSTPPVVRASNATTPLPSFASALIPRRRRRGRDAFAVFVDVYIAKHKHRLPTQKAEVRLIARPIWDGLPREEQQSYQKLAREEREHYERNYAAPALQRCGSARGNGSRNSWGRQMAAHSLSVVDRDLPHWPVAQGMDTQDVVYYAPTITPTSASEIPPIQYPDSFMMDVNTDAVPHNTLGQDMFHDQHGQATQGMQGCHQRQASISIPTVTTVPSASDSQVYNPVPYYHGTSGQTFTAMNQPTVPQYFSSAPVVAPVAHRPNPVTASSTLYRPYGNMYNHNNGWGEPSTTYSSDSSSVEVGSSSYRGRSTHGEGSSAYEHSTENTWNDSQHRQHQFWSSGYSGQSS